MRTLDGDRGRVAQLAEHLYDTQVVGGSIPPSPTNVSEWYAYNMTVNELITELDQMPADVEVGLASVGTLQTVTLSEDGERVLLGAD